MLPFISVPFFPEVYPCHRIYNVWKKTVFWWWLWCAYKMKSLLSDRRKDRVEYNGNFICRMQPKTSGQSSEKKLLRPSVYPCNCNYNGNGTSMPQFLYRSTHIYVRYVCFTMTRAIVNKLLLWNLQSLSLISISTTPSSNPAVDCYSDVTMIHRHISHPLVGSTRLHKPGCWFIQFVAPPRSSVVKGSY